MKTHPGSRIFPMAALTLLAGSALAEENRVYFGTYTRDAGSQGIYLAGFDEASGRLGVPVLAAAITNPSFLAIAPSGKALYAVSEVAEGIVQAYRILNSGMLEPINRQNSGGSAPCHVSISSDGKFLAVANYGSGSVASYRVEEDSSLSGPVTVIPHKGSSVHPERQAGPHAHSINFSPDDQFAYAADLGTDRVYLYALDGATGAFAPAGETVIAPGSGPRHFTFLPGGRFAYLINEMNLSVSAFKVDVRSGALTEIQSLSTLPEGTEPMGSTAELVSHPSGRFLYGSNRGHDSIVVYGIDPESGKLTHVENQPVRAKTPRNFVISPSGKWLLAAGQQSGNVTVFSIDPETGALTFTGEEMKIDSPVCIRFLPRR